LVIDVRYRLTAAHEIVVERAVVVEAIGASDIESG
jgi:hypothetical protein